MAELFYILTAVGELTVDLNDQRLISVAEQFVGEVLDSQEEEQLISGIFSRYLERLKKEFNSVEANLLAERIKHEFETWVFFPLQGKKTATLMM